MDESGEYCDGEWSRSFLGCGERLDVARAAAKHAGRGNCNERLNWYKKLSFWDSMV